jgi:hypothetical protein
METTTRTATGTFLGTCSGGCGTVKTTEKFVKHSCGAWITAYVPVKSRVTEHECGPRCTSALGPVCDCTCGGEAHGEDHRF